jgi:hypothetical protein
MPLQEPSYQERIGYAPGRKNLFHRRLHPPGTVYLIYFMALMMLLNLGALHLLPKALIIRNPSGI